MTLPDWDSLAELDDESLPLLPTALLERILSRRFKLNQPL